MVQRDVKHQRMMRIQSCGILGAACGDGPKQDSAACLERCYKLPPQGVMWPQAAHMQQLEPWLGHRQRSWVTEKSWWKGSHRDSDPLAHLSNERRIKCKKYRVMGLSIEVGLQLLDRVSAVM